MARVATVVPAETDLLCEGCGYTLNGLPTDGNCPECGKPIEQSIGTHRLASPYEAAPSPRTFLQTTFQVLVYPKQFYAHLSTRSDLASAARFARRHLKIASLLFGLAAAGHLIWVLQLTFPRYLNEHLLAIELVSVLVFPLLTFIMLHLITRLAAWLSAVEARYWGMRLPHAVVKRGMQFHTANYLPVGLAAASVVWGYRIGPIVGFIRHRFDDIYLYTLCGLVILSAGYLFRAYWIAMRAMMFANR